MEKKLTKDILKLASPIFLETLLIMLLGFGDILVLGRYSDNAAIAVNTANQPINIMNLVFTLIASAASVLISQALGAKNRKRASVIAIVSLIFTLVLGIFCTLFFCFMGKRILILIGLKKELLQYGQVYTLIVGGFLFLQGIISACTAIVRTHGKPRVSLNITFLKEEKDMKLFIDNISKEFKDLKAVDNVKIEFTPGQAVTTPRSDVMYVVTEYGLADLYNRPIKERVEAMISIAHPDFRQWLKNIFTLN